MRAEQLKVWLFHGCVSHWEYLERMLGYVPHTARERMRVAKRLVSLPLTMRKLADGTLTYSAVRELTRVATADTEEDWLTSTDGMSTHQIEREVAGRALGDRPKDPRPPDLRLRNLRLQLPTELYAMWRQARVALEAELGDVQFVEQLLRRALDPGTGAAGPAHQIAYKQCDDCKRATQNGGGLEVDVAAHVIEKAHCDARHIGSLDAPAPERATSSVTPRIREQVERSPPLGSRVRILDDQ